MASPLNLNLVTRITKGAPLTAIEADDNLVLLAQAIVQVNDTLESSINEVNSATAATQAAYTATAQSLNELLAASQGQLENISTIAQQALGQVNSSTTSVQTTLSNLTSQMATAQGDIGELKSTVSTATGSTTTALNLLEAQVGTVAAGFSELQQTVASTVAASTTQLTQMEASVQGVTSSITSLEQTVADNETSTTQSLNTLTSNLGTTSSTLTTLQQTVATNESTTTQSLNTLTSNLGTASASLSALQQTVATNESATSESLTNLTSELGTTNSFLNSLQQTVATNETATTEALNTLTSNLGTTSSTLTTLQQTVATANTATTKSITDLTTTVGTNTTDIAENLQSINGVAAQWGVQVNNNGRVTGVQLNSGADKTTTFAITVDKFELVDPDNTSHVPFEYDNANNTITLNAANVDINGIIDVINQGGTTKISGTAITTDGVTASNFISPDFVEGTSAAAPTGVKLASPAFPTTFLDGSQKNVNLSIGADGNFAGYDMGGLTMARIYKGGSIVAKGQTVQWTCPPNISFGTVTMSGGGGGSTPGSGGGSGGCVRFNVILVPGQTYTLVGGAPGAGNPNNTVVTTTITVETWGPDPTDPWSPDDGNYIDLGPVQESVYTLSAGAGGDSTAFGFVAKGGTGGSASIPSAIQHPTYDQAAGCWAQGGSGGEVFYEDTQISNTGGIGAFLTFNWSPVRGQTKSWPQYTYYDFIGWYDPGDDWLHPEFSSTPSYTDAGSAVLPDQPYYATGSFSGGGSSSVPTVGFLWNAAISGVGGGVAAFDVIPLWLSLSGGTVTDQYMETYIQDAGTEYSETNQYNRTLYYWPFSYTAYAVITSGVYTFTPAPAGTLQGFTSTTNVGAPSGLANGTMVFGDVAGYGAGGSQGSDGGPGFVLLQF